MKLRVSRPQNSLKVCVEVSKGSHSHSELRPIPLSDDNKKKIHQEIDSSPMIIQKKIQVFILAFAACSQLFLSRKIE